MSKAFETLSIAGNAMALACDQFRELTWELSDEQLRLIKEDVVEFARAMTHTTIVFNEIKRKLAETDDEKERVKKHEGFAEMIKAKLERLESLAQGEKIDEKDEWPEELDDLDK